MSYKHIYVHNVCVFIYLCVCLCVCVCVCVCVNASRCHIMTQNYTVTPLCSCKWHNDKYEWACLNMYRVCDTEVWLYVSHNHITLHLRSFYNTAWWCIHHIIPVMPCTHHPVSCTHTDTYLLYTDFPEHCIPTTRAISNDVSLKLEIYPFLNKTSSFLYNNENLLSHKTQKLFVQ